MLPGPATSSHQSSRVAGPQAEEVEKGPLRLSVPRFLFLVSSLLLP